VEKHTPREGIYNKSLRYINLKLFLFYRGGDIIALHPDCEDGHDYEKIGTVTNKYGYEQDQYRCNTCGKIKRAAKGEYWEDQPLHKRIVQE